MTNEALVNAADHGWEGSRWLGAAAAMTGYADLLGHQPADAERRTAEALAAGPAASPPLRSAVHAVHGAAAFDLGDRADGLAELQQARSDLGDNPTSPQHRAATAMLEFRAALQLGHAAAARTVLGWLTERTGDNTEPVVAEPVMMRAWADPARGRHEHARTLIRPVLDGSTPALLPHTLGESWLLETSIAVVRQRRRGSVGPCWGWCGTLAVAEWPPTGPGCPTLTIANTTHKFRWAASRAAVSQQVFVAIPEMITVSTPQGAELSRIEAMEPAVARRVQDHVARVDHQAGVQLSGRGTRGCRGRG